MRRMSKVLALLLMAVLLSSFFASATASPAGAATPAKFKVSNLLIEPKEAGVGESVMIRAEVANEGEETGNYTATFKINGTAEYTRTVSVMGKKGTLVIYITARDAPGTYLVDVEGLTGSFKVTGEAKTTLWQNPWLWVGVALGILVILFLVWRMRRRAPAG